MLVLSSELRFWRNVLLKAALLFAAANVAFAAANPLPALGQVSAYNTLFPGRPRFPFGETPERAFNFSLYNFNAMWAAHELAGARKAPDEFRVLLVGDSSVWGTLLRPEETLAGQINAGDYRTADGRRVRAFNLGYPTMSLTKDLLILDRARQFEPDLIVWLVTLESFPRATQFASPLAQQNAPLVRELIARFNLRLDPQHPDLAEPDRWARTLVGQRRNLADLLRLQLYGAAWAATGVDQFYPETYTPRANDLEAEETYYAFTPPQFPPDALAFDVLVAGHELADDIPLLVINEPVFISNGRNSKIRYNFYYPRWAYDDYRRLLAAEAERNGWNYVDVWSFVERDEFTNTAVHLSPRGSAQLAQRLSVEILELAQR
jgi:hypothetical protein